MEAAARLAEIAQHLSVPRPGLKGALVVSNRSLVVSKLMKRIPQLVVAIKVPGNDPERAPIRVHCGPQAPLNGQGKAEVVVILG
jgi:hypothetical protein